MNNNTDFKKNTIVQEKEKTMIKLLFIPTGNVFTLPDEEASRIIKQDRGNYKVLEGGIITPEEPKQLDKKTVKELVMKEETQEEEQEEIPVQEETKTGKFTREEIEGMTRKELYKLGTNFNVDVSYRITRDVMVQRICEKLGL